MVRVSRENVRRRQSFQNVASKSTGKRSLGRPKPRLKDSNKNIY